MDEERQGSESEPLNNVLNYLEMRLNAQEHNFVLDTNRHFNASREPEGTVIHNDMERYLSIDDTIGRATAIMRSSVRSVEGIAENLHARNDLSTAIAQHEYVSMMRHPLLDYVEAVRSKKTISRELKRINAPGEGLNTRRIQDYHVILLYLNNLQGCVPEFTKLLGSYHADLLNCNFNDARISRDLVVKYVESSRKTYDIPLIRDAEFARLLVNLKQGAVDVMLKEAENCVSSNHAMGKKSKHFIEHARKIAEFSSLAAYPALHKFADEDLGSYFENRLLDIASKAKKPTS